MRGRLFVLVLLLVSAVPALAAITGTLMNADGQPVAGAKVSIYAPESADARLARLVSDKPERVPVATTQSSDKGRFSLDSPKEPVADLEVVATGFAPYVLRVERDEETGAIALSPAETKQGRITANGKPVAGARVIWLGRFETSATTDVEGRYSVVDPSKWATRVVVMHPEFALHDETQRYGRKMDVNRVLQSGSPLSGRVVGEDGKTGVAGAAVRMGGLTLATTGEDGAFTIAHVPPKWEWLDARLGNLAGMRARGGDPSIVIRLAKTASVSGTVRDTKSQAAVSGTELTLRTAGRLDSYSPSAMTDAKGNFSISGVAPGSYELAGLRPGFNVTPIMITVAAGDKSVKTVMATQLARVSGTVSNEDNQPVAGARISQEIVSRDGAFGFPRTIVAQQTQMSAPDGSFVLRVDPDTSIQIQGQKKGYPGATSATLRLGPGERKSGVALTIPSGIEISGRVTDRDQRPVAAVLVAPLAAADSRGGDAAMVRRLVFMGSRDGADDNMVKTASDGTFALRLKEGTYDLNFKRDGFSAKTVRGYQVTKAANPVEVVLDPGVEVRGRVLRNGVGIEGVNIMGFGGPDNVTAETGPDGSFTLTDLTPGDLQVNFSKTDEFIQVMRRITVPSDEIVVEIPSGGRVVGRVVDKTTKQPVTTFEAGISPSRGGGMMVMIAPPQTRPFTSESGSFVLDNVPPGTTTVAVRAPGYTMARVPNITVEEGKATQEVEVALDRGVRVKGKVTGPDGAPVSGATVRIDFMANGRIMRATFNDEQAVTDASGEFTFDSMEPGERTFNVTKSGFVGAQKTVDLKGSETRVELQLSSGIRVSGTVVSESGSPVAEADVSANSAAGGGMASRSAKTDANGNFVLEGVPPGRYNFSAYKAGQAPGQLRDFDVATGAPARIVMKTGGTITGRILGLTPEELPQVQVWAQSPNGGASGVVDATGNYRVDGAPTGTVRLMARVGGSMGMGGRQAGQVSVEVTSGGSVQQDLEFRAGTSVRGRVTRDGRPVADAMVMFAPRNAEAQTYARTQTDRDGYYEATGLDDATYNVNVADLQRGGSYSATYEVRGGGTFDIDMRTTTVRGRVVDASTGSPVSEATVMLRRKDPGGLPYPSATVMTDASGAFIFDTVGAGPYHVTAEKEDYGSKVSDITVGTSPEELEIKLSPTAGVTMRVIDGRDGRLLRAFVRVADAQNRVVYESMRWGGGGSPEPLKLTLDPGSYRVTVMAPGYATQTISIMSPSTPTVALTPGGAILVQSKGSSLRRARLMAPDGRVYERSFSPMGIFTVDPSPGTTVIENIAPGVYTLQILGAGDSVETSTQVTVGEGQRVTVEI
jgi:large repetitive protein